MDIFIEIRVTFMYDYFLSTPLLSLSFSLCCHIGNDSLSEILHYRCHMLSTGPLPSATLAHKVATLLSHEQHRNSKYYARASGRNAMGLEQTKYLQNFHLRRLPSKGAIFKFNTTFAIMRYDFMEWC